MRPASYWSKCPEVGHNRKLQTTTNEESIMSHVWILSEGEKYEGEQVLGVYATYDGAMAELRALAEMVGDVEIKEDWSTASFEDGIFYTIIREKELRA
jgi:hypothetical protein